MSIRYGLQRLMLLVLLCWSLVASAGLSQLSPLERGHVLWHATGPGMNAMDESPTFIGFTQAMIEALQEHEGKFNAAYPAVAQRVVNASKGNLFQQPVFSMQGYLSSLKPQDGQKGKALVIGNANYKNFPGLRGPIKDANRVAGLLASFGFQITHATDLDGKSLRKRVDAFANSIDATDLVVVFFSGHGGSDGDTDYLMPVDVGTDMKAAALSVSDLRRSLKHVLSTIIIVDIDRSQINSAR